MASIAGGPAQVATRDSAESTTQESPLTGGTATSSTAARQSSLGMVIPELSSVTEIPVDLRVPTSCSDESLGLASSMRQMAPAMCGAACEVPEMLSFPPPAPALMMLSPGARSSSSGERLVKAEMSPGLVSWMDPTETTFCMQEGRAREFRLPLLPDAARTSTPSSRAAATAPAMASFASSQLSV